MPQVGDGSGGGGRQGVIGALFVAVVVLLTGVRQRLGRRDQPSPELEASVASGYETRDIPFRAFLIFGVVLVGTVAVLVLVASTMLSISTNTGIYLGMPTGGIVNAPQKPVPTPVVNTVQSGAEAAQLRQQAEQTLSSYDWIDKPNGVARIPIDDAMDVIAAKGLPTRPGAPPAPDLSSGGSEGPSSWTSGR